MKTVLVAMEKNEIIDMRNATHKFAVSWVTIQVVELPIAAFVRAWNSHRIPGHAGGIPNALAEQSTQLTPVDPIQVPSVCDAVTLHEATHSSLTRELTYGMDPINGHPHLQALRERDFFLAFPSMDALFTNILHSDGGLFSDAILSFISLSLRFSQLI